MHTSWSRFFTVKAAQLFCTRQTFILSRPQGDTICLEFALYYSAFDALGKF